MVCYSCRDHNKAAASPHGQNAISTAGPAAGGGMLQVRRRGKSSKPSQGIVFYGLRSKNLAALTCPTLRRTRRPRAKTWCAGNQTYTDDGCDSLPKYPLLIVTRSPHCVCIVVPVPNFRATCVQPWQTGKPRKLLLPNTTSQERVTFCAAYLGTRTECN